MKIENERLYYGGPLRRAPWWQRPRMALRRWRGRRQLNNWVVLGDQARSRPGPCLCELVAHPFCRVVTCRCDHGI